MLRAASLIRLSSLAWCRFRGGGPAFASATAMAESVATAFVEAMLGAKYAGGGAHVENGDGHLHRETAGEHVCRRAGGHVRRGPCPSMVMNTKNMFSAVVTVMALDRSIR